MTADAPTPDDSSGEAEITESPPTAETGDSVLRGILGVGRRPPPSALLPGAIIDQTYRIVRELGAGGMGVVYLARDLRLNRDVAIKLHLTGRNDRGVARLIREASAIAQLSHVNVVTIFQIDSYDGHPFVAMEYVDGGTARAWLRERPRTWREIVALYVAAGRGLAAAHRAGLVHRDFKPDNVLVGTDGRIRVADFGLVQGTLPSSDGGESGDDLGAPVPDDLTRTGTVMGTPAYMAPEQHRADEIGPAADQFGFCVALWEALYGQRPYDGATAEQIAAAITARRLREPPADRGVPRQIRRTLERGLALEPGARFASMDELLAELTRDPTRGRRRIAIALAAVGVTGGAIAVVAATAGSTSSTGAGAPACDQAGAEVDSVGDALIDGLAALGGPYATGATERVRDRVAIFERDYRASSRVVCEEVAARRWSTELGDRGRACLDVRRQNAERLLSGTVSLLTAPDFVQRAIDLPDPALCSDATLLASQPAVPTDPTLAEAIVAARAALDSAISDLRNGHTELAVRAIAEVEASPAGAEAVIVPRLIYTRALLSRRNGDMLGADKLLADAYFAARGIDDVDTALGAVAMLISGNGKRGDEAAPGWIQNGIADASRARARAPRSAAAVYVTAASVEDTNGDTVAANGYLAEAISLLGDEPSPSLMSTHMIRASVRITAGDEPGALADYQRAIELARVLYGPDHPRVADIEISAASGLLDLRESEAAHALAADVERILAMHVPLPGPNFAYVLINLGAVQIDVGEPELAVPRFQDARARLVAAYGEDHADVAMIDTNLAKIHAEAGRYDQAITLFRAVLAHQQTLVPDPHEDRGLTHYSLAVALRDAGQPAAAIDQAVLAAAQFQVGDDRRRFAFTLGAEIAAADRKYTRALELADQALALPPASDPTAGAWPVLVRGRALLATGDASTGRRLLTEARAVYLAEGSAERVAEIDALLTTPR